MQLKQSSTARLATTDSPAQRTTRQWSHHQGHRTAEVQHQEACKCRESGPNIFAAANRGKTLVPFRSDRQDHVRRRGSCGPPSSRGDNRPTSRPSGPCPRANGRSSTRFESARAASGSAGSSSRQRGKGGGVDAAKAPMHRLIDPLGPSAEGLVRLPDIDEGRPTSGCAITESADNGLSGRCGQVG